VTVAADTSTAHVDDPSIGARANAHDLALVVSLTSAALQARARVFHAAMKVLQAGAFPAGLAAGMQPIPLDGDVLARTSFSGFSRDVAKLIVDFVVRVMVLDEHMDAMRNLVVKLEKPVTDMFAARASGTHSIRHVVLLGGAAGKDPNGNPVAVLAELQSPLDYTGAAPAIPNNIEAVFGGQRVSASKYKSGTLDKPVAVYVAPSSFESVCPNENKTVAAQLMIRLEGLSVAIEGEPVESPDEPNATEPLMVMAKRLTKALETMQ
jgi:hypothetical protein